MAFGDPGTGGPLETELRNIPATWLDRPANWLEKVRQVAEAAQTAAGPRTEILPAILKLLIGNKPEMMRDVSGGFPVTEGSGETLHVKPQYAGDVMDFALASAGVSKVAKALVNAGMSGPLGKAAQEGVLRFGGDPQYMYSHGISGSLHDPNTGGMITELMHPSLAITGQGSHYNPFGNAGILIPKPGAFDPAYSYSTVFNRDAYIARTGEFPGGRNPSAGQRASMMGLLPPARSEGSSYNSWLKSPSETGFLRADPDYMKRAEGGHNAAIFSSPAFRSLAEFEKSPRGGGTLQADKHFTHKSIEDISNDYRDWFARKGRGDSYGADWLETLREYAKEGDREASQLLERFKRAPSDYGEMKVSGAVPLTGERWAGAILPVDAYNSYAEMLSGRGIPSILTPTTMGNQRWKQVHDIAQAMQEMAGPVKERSMRVGAGWTPGQDVPKPAMKIEAPPGETPVSRSPPSEWQGMAKKPPAGLTQEQADIHAAAIKATEDLDYDGYTAIFTHKGQAYHMDAESGAIINSDTHHIVGNIDNPKGISLSSGDTQTMMEKAKNVFDDYGSGNFWHGGKNYVVDGEGLVHESGIGHGDPVGNVAKVNPTKNLMEVPEDVAEIKKMWDFMNKGDKNTVWHTDSTHEIKVLGPSNTWYSVNAKGDVTALAFGKNIAVGNIQDSLLGKLKKPKGAASFDSKEDAMKAAQKSMIKQEAQNVNDKDLLNFISMLDSHGVPPGLLEKAAAVHTPSLKGSTKFDNHGKEYFVNQTGDVLYKGYPVGNVKDATKAVMAQEVAKVQTQHDAAMAMQSPDFAGTLIPFESGGKKYKVDKHNGDVFNDKFGDTEVLFKAQKFGGGAPADLAWQKMKAAQAKVPADDIMKQYDMGLLPPGQAYKMLAEKFAKNLHNGPPLAADEMAQLEWFQKHLGDIPQ